MDTNPDTSIPSVVKHSNIGGSSEEYSSIHEEQKFNLQQVPSVLPAVQRGSKAKPHRLSRAYNRENLESNSVRTG